VEHIPDSWSKNKKAGPDWFTAFIKRHQELSIRKPQPTSLARATAFNRTTVAEFCEHRKMLIGIFCVAQSFVSDSQICSLITRNCIPSEWKRSSRRFNAVYSVSMVCFVSVSTFNPLAHFTP
jgi:hypothetical protein